MIQDRLQLWLDQALATCRQRWWMGATAVGAVVAACLIVLIGNASPRGIVIIAGVTIGFAVVAVAGSGTHHGSIAIGLVALSSTALLDDVTSPRVLAVAICLYVFHVLLALMAATRHTSPLASQILARWALRSVPVIAATVAMWCCVLAFERQDLIRNTWLTLLAVVTIAAAAVVFRRQAVVPADRAA